MFADKYRPQNEKQIIGKVQKELIRELAESPIQRLCLVGGSGIGKTTIIRMYAAMMNADLKLFNGRDIKKADIDTIKEGFNFPSMTHPYKMYFIDEIHDLDKKHGQGPLLDALEDLSDNILFCIATNQPSKLVDAFHSRFRFRELKVPTRSEMFLLGKSIIKKELGEFNHENELERAIENCQGNLRVLVNYVEDICQGVFDPHKEEMDEESFMFKLFYRDLTLSEMYGILNSESQIPAYSILDQANKIIIGKANDKKLYSKALKAIECFSIDADIFQFRKELKKFYE